MNGIHMVFVDLDGTVLRADKSVSDFTVRVFDEVRQKGVKLAILTARIYPTAERFAQLLRANSMACCNGAVIYSGGRVVHTETIPWSNAAYLLRQIEERIPGSLYSVMYENVMYTNYPDNHTVRFHSLAELPALPVQRILVQNAGERGEALLQDMRDSCAITLLERRNLSITSARASKLHAMEFLLAYHQIASAHTAGFGDDVNDIGFVSRCGIGVAVSNAEPELKEKAHFICGSHDEDGSAHWLRDYLCREAL